MDTIGVKFRPVALGMLTPVPVCLAICVDDTCSYPPSDMTVEQIMVNVDAPDVVPVFVISYRRGRVAVCM